MRRVTIESEVEIDLDDYAEAFLEDLTDDDLLEECENRGITPDPGLLETSEFLEKIHSLYKAESHGQERQDKIDKIIGEEIYDKLGRIV